MDHGTLLLTLFVASIILLAIGSYTWSAKQEYAIRLPAHNVVDRALAALEANLISHGGRFDSVVITRGDGAISYSGLKEAIPAIREPGEMLLRIEVFAHVEPDSSRDHKLRFVIDRFLNYGGPVLTLTGNKFRKSLMTDLYNSVGWWEPIDHPNQRPAHQDPPPGQENDNRPLPDHVLRLITHQPLAVQIVGGIIATLVASLITYGISRLLG